MSGRIAVTGATGRQGGAVVRALVADGWQVRALSRHAASPEAIALSALNGVEHVACDLEDRAAIDRALAGIEALFLTTTPYERGAAAEERQAVSALETARARGVRQVVYSSVAGARDGTGVDHYESKGRIERRLEQLDFPTATVLRPTFFMEMFRAPFFARFLTQGRIEMAMDPDVPIAMIAVDDIAAFARLAFREPRKLNRHAIELAGDHPTMADVAAAMTAATGRRIEYAQVAPHDLAVDIRPKLATQRWLEHEGWRVDVTGLRARYGVPLTDFATWARRYVREAG